MCVAVQYKLLFCLLLSCGRACNIGLAIFSTFPYLFPSYADYITRLVKVHMRRRHGGPPAEPRNDMPSGHYTPHIRTTESEKDILLGSHTIQHTAKDIYQQQRLDDDDDNNSVLSRVDSIPSVFSMKSATTSVTGVSSVNGYSSNKIAAVSKELSSIFSENEVMLPLYEIALTSPAIGPDRLQRNLRRLFKSYSEHLKDEAADQFEYLAAQLVAMRSRGLSKSIVEKLRSDPVPLRTTDHGHDSDSSDDEAPAGPVDEQAWADLDSFRKFLVESEAFETLQAQLLAFGLQESPEPRMIEDSDDDCRSHTSDGRNLRHVKPPVRKDLKNRTWQYWWRDAAETAYACLCNSQHLPTTTLLLYSFVDLVFMMTDGTLTNAGLLEPPLHPAKIRLRWSSVSDTLFLLM
jgi:hypothetical protein